MSEQSKKSIFFSDLNALADNKYKNFTAKLIPNISEDNILGVRIPLLRKLSKKLLKEEPEKVEIFMQDLPHTYFDENNLHGFLLCEEKDFSKVISHLQIFLPYVDNWASCDLINPKIFKKHKSEVLAYIRTWMFSDHEYTVRFGIEMLMTYFLDEDFKSEYLKWVVAVQHETYAYDTYYVKMMMAWYFATALSKQYNETLPILEDGLLETWVHNKTIQKSRESNRISPEIKNYLQSLKR